MSYQKRAEALFMNGYNCAQSTAAAFAGVFGLSEPEILRLTSGFGGGIGGLRSTCGAVTGMAFVAGLAKGEYAPEDHGSKSELYALIQAAHAEFLSRYGTDCCRELLDRADCGYSAEPSLRTPEYYATRPCARYVGAAAGIIAAKLGLER